MNRTLTKAMMYALLAGTAVAGAAPPPTHDRGRAEQHNGWQDRSAHEQRPGGRYDGQRNQSPNWRNDGSRNDGWRNDDRRNDGWRNDRRDSYRSYGRDRFHHGYYYAPRGYYQHDWRRGERLPGAFYGRPYIVRDYYNYRLYAPPYGCEWVRVNNDVVLTAIATGIVLDVLYNLYY